MDVILKKIYNNIHKTSSGTVLIGIPEQKKKQNYTNIAASAKTSFGHSLFYKKL